MSLGSQLVRADSHESVFSLTSCVSGVGSWQPGDRARIDQRSGIVAYVGPTKFAPGEWIGLILDEPLGKNDGSVQGYRYFSCKPEHGLFCKSSKLERIVLSPSRLKSPSFGDGEPISPYAVEYGFDICDRVVVSGGKHGIVRFIGETEFAQGVWAGIELEQPLGKNDGSLQGKRYFTCKAPYGIFVPASKVLKASSQTPGKMTVVQTKTSLLRQNRGLGGSRESLSSIGRSSVASSRFGQIRKPSLPHHSYSVPSSGYNATIKALEEALREKERHLEQVMRERDMERSENSQLSNGDQAQVVIAKLQSDKNNLECALLEKEKLLDDLAFRLEEETISRECQVEELQKRLALFENSSASEKSSDDNLPGNQKTDAKCREWEAKCLELEKEIQKLDDAHSATCASLTADIAALKSQLSSVEGDKEKFKMLLEEERKSGEANNKLLEMVRAELETAKEQLLSERLSFEEQLSAAKADAQEKTNLLTAATCSSTETEKELMKTRAELQLSLKEAEDQRKIVETLTSNKGSTEAVLVEKVDALERDLQTKMKDLHSMEMGKKALENELEDMKLNTEVLHKEKKLLQESLETTKSEKASSDELLNEQRKEIERLLNDHMENIAALTAERDAKKTMLRNVEANSMSLLAENNELRAKLSALEGNNLMANNKADMRCAELEKQLKEAEVKITTGMAELLSKDEELVALKENLKEIEVRHKNEVDSLVLEQSEHVEKLSASLNSMQSAHNELLEKYGNLEMKMADLLKNVVVERELFNSKEKELCDQIISITGQWKATEVDLLEKLEKEQLLTEKLTSEKNELEQLYGAIEMELNKRLKEICSLSGKVEELESEHTQIMESKAQVEERLRQQEDAFTALKNTVDSSKLGEYAMANDLAAANTLSAERLAEIDRLQALVQSLEEKLSVMESLSSQPARKRSDSEERLIELVEVRENDIKQLQEHLNREKTVRSNLEEQLQAKSAESSELQRNVDLLTSKSTELDALLENLRLDLHEKEVQLEAARNKRTAAVMAKSEAENQVSELMQQLEQKRKIVESSRELLSSDNDIFTKKLATREEAEQLLKDDLAAAGLRVDQLSQENLLLSEQNYKLSVDGDGLDEKVKNELAIAMEQVQSMTEERISFEKEVEKLKEELFERQRQVNSLLLNEANANVLVSEAKQKIELYNELEQEWKRKQIKMSDKIEDLTIQLEQAKARTQNEEIDSLRKELAFSHSIIADQRRKEAALQRKIDALNKLSVDLVTNDTNHLSCGVREKKLRAYCDICEAFDQHDTEDCPKQENERVDSRQKARKPPIPPREYCDNCEVFGHDTSLCGTHQNRKKKDYTF